MPEVVQRQFRLLFSLTRWLPVATTVGIMAGAASATLLWSLTVATNVRESHPWLILLLAPVGYFVGLMYKHLGREVEAGNNLILEEVHEPSDVIPIRMTPLILIGTFLTHLFGGSAGREGTAIQTGASLADQLTHVFRFDARDRRILLMAGISGGFASVFGTPLAGAVFGLEVLAIGALTYDALAPCFIAAFTGDLTTRWIAEHVPGVAHTVYTVKDAPAVSLKGIGCAVVAGAVFGLASMGFARLTHTISRWGKRRIARPELRPVLGGVLVTIAVFALHTTRYIGLGVPTIIESFHRQQPPWDFAAKILFTAVTLGFGFKGGEVTPLFFIGATLGSTLSYILPLPTAELAGMGFAAVFAGAANTPIASTLMAIELFGPEVGALAGIACVGSYLCSGHAGIYHAQRLGRSKYDEEPDALAAKDELLSSEP